MFKHEINNIRRAYRKFKFFREHRNDKWRGFGLPVFWDSYKAERKL